MISQCSKALLEAALAGSLPAGDEASLERHLAECEACGAAMEQLAGGATSRQEAAALLGRDELDHALPVHDEWSEADFTVEHLEPSDEPNVLGRLGGYDVLEIIGRGGMGVVLKAFDRELKRCVAIKVVAPHLAHNSLAKKRFAREAQAAAAVVHPHVLAIHHVQPNGRLPFLVMPLVAGESLAQRLKTQGTLELKEILRIGMQAAAGLGAAHDQGLVHRDVKPANILLELGVERAVLTDFGLARAADDVSMTRWGIIAGTPEYMSPEQAKGEPLDGRSDLFSLGCVLFEMATGVSPFRTDSAMATMRRLVDDAPQAMASLNPELPPWFIAIVDRLLEKEPSRRFGSAKEVTELLEGCLAHLQQPASVPLPAALPKLVPWPDSGWRKSRLKGVIAMFAILGIGVLGWIILFPPEPAHNISFGPAIERILEPCAAPDFPALNLDTGNIVNGESFPNLDLYEVREAWRQKSGAHLVVTKSPDQQRIFGFVELRVISSRLWDQAAVPGAAVLTITASTDSGELRFSNTPDPATYAFKTRKGTFGLLQLLGTTQTNGIKIRYKLARPNVGGPADGLPMTFLPPNDRTEEVVNPKPSEGPPNTILVTSRLVNARPNQIPVQRFWLDPMRGYAVVRRDLRNTDPEKLPTDRDYHDLMDQWEQTPNGAWYPTRVNAGSLSRTTWYDFFLDFTADMPDDLFKPAKRTVLTDRYPVRS